MDPRSIVRIVVRLVRLFLSRLAKRPERVAVPQPPERTWEDLTPWERSQILGPDGLPLFPSPDSPRPKTPQERLEETHEVVINHFSNTPTWAPKGSAAQNPQPMKTAVPLTPQERLEQEYVFDPYSHPGHWKKRRED